MQVPDTGQDLRPPDGHPTPLRPAPLSSDSYGDSIAKSKQTYADYIVPVPPIDWDTATEREVRDELRRLQPVVEGLQGLQRSYDELQRSYDDWKRDSRRRQKELQSYNAILQRDEQHAQSSLRRAKATAEKKQASNEEYKSRLQEQRREYVQATESANEKHLEALAEKDAAITKAVGEKAKANKEKDSVISDKDAVIKDRDAAIKDKDSALAEKDASIKEKDARIERLCAEAQQYSEAAKSAVKNREIEWRVEIGLLQNELEVTKTQLKEITAQLKDATKHNEKVAAEAMEALFTEIQARLLEVILDGKFKKEGIESFMTWYANAHHSKDLPSPPGAPRYTEEQAVAIYEEGKVMGYYEHEIGDDLRTVKVRKMEAQVENFEKRTAFFTDRKHKKNPYQLGREAGRIVIGAKIAKNVEKPDMDPRVMKGVPVAEPHIRLVPKEARPSNFWDGYAETGKEVALKILDGDKSHA